MENISLTEIKELIVNTERSKIYKSSSITDTYNKIFNKNEKPTNCGSCLRTLFLKIKNFYSEELKKQTENEGETTPEDELLIEEAVNEIIEDKIEQEKVIENKTKSKKKNK